MGQNKLDRLFQEAAGNYSPTPSENAWEAIESQIEPKGKSKINWLYVAASVAILAVLSIPVKNYLSYQKEDTLANSGPGPVIVVDAPSMEAVAFLKIPISTISESYQDEVKKEKMDNLIVPELILDASQNEKVQIAMLSIELHPRTIEQPIITGLKEISIQVSDLPPAKVEIKYYAGATDEATDTSKRKIDKLIEYAQSTSPAEMLAKARNAKDNFLSSKFSLD